MRRFAVILLLLLVTLPCEACQPAPPIDAVFAIDRTGRLVWVYLKTSSGVNIYDEALLDAVKNAAPFPVLPAGSPDTVSFVMRFDYNLWTNKPAIKLDESGYVPPPGSDAWIRPKEPDVRLFRTYFTFAMDAARDGDFKQASFLFGQCSRCDINSVAARVNRALYRSTKTRQFRGRIIMQSGSVLS